MDGPNYSRQIDEPNESLFSGRRRGCFQLPCFNRSGTPSSPSTSVGLRSSWWQKIRTTAEITSGDSGSLWARGVIGLKKIREWSEIVAGPRWKTFIRRFNRDRNGGRHANFQYDSLSYAMNFDEGPGQKDQDEEGEDGYYYGPRNFSTRYAKGSMDLGKDGPTFV